jgi:hypothetical protein
MRGLVGWAEWGLRDGEVLAMATDPMDAHVKTCPTL